MKKLVIAHRGASAYEVENTIESFKKAMLLGSDMIEFDVRKTKDEVLIICHNENIGDFLIKELDYKEIEEKIGHKVPTLEETIEFLSGKIKVDVEIKEIGYEKEIIDLMLKYFKEYEFVVTSFEDQSIRKVKDFYPEIRTGLLLGKKKSNNLIKTKISEIFFEKRCKNSKADFLVLNWKLLCFGLLKRAEKMKKAVIVWTVDDEKKMKKFFTNENVEGIITNRPDIAIKIRDCGR